MSSDTGIEPTLVDDLLALETREHQTKFLRDADLLDADGLDRLLDAAEQLTRDDPGKAQSLAAFCAQTADNAAAPAAVPRAGYIQVQTHYASGEFDAALHLAESSYGQYVALGMNLEALRTRIGRMAVFLELGRYQETLDAGQSILYTLEGKGGLDMEPTQAEYDLLAAPVHQNRGVCYEYMGRYDAALDEYAAAEERYRALDMVQRIGEISDNRGAILSYLGRTSEALAAHQAAADVFEEAGLTFSYAKALSNMGVEHLRAGSYARSLETFEHARRLFRRLDSTTVQYGVLLVHTAEAYLNLNLYPDAVATYQEASGLLQDAGMAYSRAEALWGEGSALIAESKFQEADPLLVEAADTFKQAGNVPLLSGVMLEQASLLQIRGNKEAALKIAHQALALVSANKWPIQAIYARLRLADLLMPDASAVELHLREAQRLADRVSLPQLRFRLNERVGHLRRLQGRSEEAKKLLEAAVEEIERLRGTVVQDAMRASFFRDKIAAFEGLLQLHLSESSVGSNERAFAIAERAKSRSLVDLLTGMTESVDGVSVDVDLKTRLQNMQADLNAVYNELLGGPDEPEHEKSFSNLQARAAELEREISRLRLQVGVREAATDPFTNTRSDVVGDRLPSDELLVAYHVVGDEIMAFIVGNGSVQVSRQLGTTIVLRKLIERLISQWDRFRAGKEFAVKHMTALERSTRQLLSALHEQLVAPLEPLVEEMSNGTRHENDVQKLVIVPHGLLHQVPFHALFDGEQYLIDRFEISYAPSATVYLLCRKRESDHQDKALAFGVDDPTIPAATIEVRAAAKRLPKTKVYVGEAATVEALKNEVSGCGTLHLACHGLFRSDNPMFSALKLHDRWLMAADVMDLDLNGALVTLSACESGRNEIYGGDETIGLTRAFFGAGAATLAVSLWLVQDETTAQLMGEWYDRLRGGQGRAAALRAAQLEIKKRYAHPYYWAPFVLIGKR